jgi:hypothetical protein
MLKGLKIWKKNSPERAQGSEWAVRLTHKHIHTNPIMFEVNLKKITSPNLTIPHHYISQYPIRLLFTD